MGHLIGVLLLALLESRLMQRTVYQCVFRVHYGSFRVLLHLFLYACRLVVANLYYPFAVGQLRDHLLRLAVHFKQLYRQIAGRVLVAYLLVVFQLRLYRLYSLFYCAAVVEVNVAEHTVLRLASVGEVLAVAASVVTLILAVPVLNVLRHFGVYVSLLVDEVHTLIHVDDDVEQQFHALSCLEHRWHHGNTKQLSQFAVVELVAAVFKLVKHVQRTNHSEVHVDKLGGQIQVAFKVARVQHVEHHVGRLVDNLTPHV